MDDNEYRRRCLRNLTNQLGRGGIAKLADALEISSTYVSRMLSSPGTKQHRPITGDTVLAISKLYPDWLHLGDKGTSQPTKARSAKSTSAAFSSDEKVLLQGFRNADPKDRETMLFLARRATEVFSERAGKK